MNSEKILDGLKNSWNFKNRTYWDPLIPLSPKPTVFVAYKLLTLSDCEAIVRFIKDNHEKIYSIDELNNKLYEESLDDIESELEPNINCCGFSESIFFDISYDWVIYRSHEGTITFGGDKLIDLIQTLFADRMDLLNKYEFQWGS